MNYNKHKKEISRKPLQVNAWIWSFRDPSNKKFPENVNLWYNYWDIK